MSSEQKQHVDLERQIVYYLYMGHPDRPQPDGGAELAQLRSMFNDEKVTIEISSDGCYVFKVPVKGVDEMIIRQIPFSPLTDGARVAAVLGKAKIGESDYCGVSFVRQSDGSLMGIVWYGARHSDIDALLRNPESTHPMRLQLRALNKKDETMYFSLAEMSGSIKGDQTALNEGLLAIQSAFALEKVAQAYKLLLPRKQR
jgi:hypothetical protein